MPSFIAESICPNCGKQSEELVPMVQNPVYVYQEKLCGQCTPNPNADTPKPDPDRATEELPSKPSSPPKGKKK